MFIVAMRMAMSMPMSPLTMPVRRAVRTVAASEMAGCAFFQMSTVNAVEMLLMFDEMVDIVAANTAAMSKPAMPAGS